MHVAINRTYCSSWLLSTCPIAIAETDFSGNYSSGRKAKAVSIVDDNLPMNARKMGLDHTLNSLKQLLVEEFQLASDPSSLASDEPLFSAGVGLSSLDGMELLAAIEKKYGVPFQDLEFWVDESPTLDGVARYLIDNSPANEPSSS